MFDERCRGQSRHVRKYGARQCGWPAHTLWRSVRAALLLLRVRMGDAVADAGVYEMLKRRVLEVCHVRQNMGGTTAWTKVPLKLHRRSSMWWFVNKARASRISTERHRPIESEEHLLKLIADMDRVTDQEVAIKIWLPSSVALTLKWVADYQGVNQSRWVRQRLFAYLYGSAAMLAHEIRARRKGYDGPMFSRPPVDRTAGRYVYKLPQLGKNLVAFKVMVSQQMRDDLLALAAHADTGLSPFVREAITADLLGRGSLPERPAIMGRPTEAAIAWERGDGVPMRAIEEHAFDHVGEAEREWVDHA